MIFVSDIMKKKPEEATWTFETLRTNITEGELEIIKFDFMDMQVYISLVPRTGNIKRLNVLF